MADQNERHLSLVFGDLTAGYSTQYPYCTQTPDSGVPVLRAMENMLPFKGQLISGLQWSAISGLSPTIGGPASTTNESPTGQIQQHPEYIFAGSQLPACPAVETDTIIVTSREVWVRRNGAITRSTPQIYTGGPMKVQTSGATKRTVTVTTGGGSYPTLGQSAFQVRGLLAPCIIRISNVNYVVASVDSDTVLTLAEDGPTTGVGGNAFTLYRCWGGPYLSPGEQSRITPVFCCFQGSSLFIATSRAAYDYTHSVYVPAVMELPLWYLGGTRAEYILSGINTYTVTNASLGEGYVSDIGGASTIYGIAPGIDGRLVLEIQEAFDITGNQDMFPARSRYSSHLDTSKWKYTPAGFSDHQTLEASRGLGTLGERLVAYSEKGIEVGEPTGQKDPPYYWHRAPGAHVGTRWPKTIQETPYGSAFLGSDGIPYIFDGQSLSPLADETVRGDLSDLLPNLTGAFHYERNVFGKYLKFRNEYHLVVNRESFKASSFAAPTMTGTHLVFDLTRGTWARLTYSQTHLTCLADAPLPMVMDSTTSAIEGLPFDVLGGFASYGLGSGQTSNSSMVWSGYLNTWGSASPASYVYPVYGSSVTRTHSVTIASQDFGLKRVVKTLKRVTVECYCPGTGSYNATITVTATPQPSDAGRTDGSFGDPSVSITQAVSSAPMMSGTYNTEQVDRFFFDFDPALQPAGNPSTIAAEAFTFTIASSTTPFAMLKAVTIEAVARGDARKVTYPIT